MWPQWRPCLPKIGRGVSVKRSKLEGGIELTDCDNSVYMMINCINRLMDESVHTDILTNNTHTRH